MVTLLPPLGMLSFFIWSLDSSLQRIISLSIKRIFRFLLPWSCHWELQPLICIVIVIHALFLLFSFQVEIVTPSHASSLPFLQICEGCQKTVKKTWYSKSLKNDNNEHHFHLFHHHHHHDHNYCHYDCFNSHNIFFSIFQKYQGFVIPLYSVHTSLISTQSPN